MNRAARLAAAVLTRCGASEALLGDLLEDYRAGRSSLWYWRQVLQVCVSTIAALLWRDIAAVVLAVVVGIILQEMWKFGWDTLWRHGVRAVVFRASHLPGGGINLIVVQWLNVVAVAPVWVGVGWVLARVSRRRPFTAVALFLAFPVLLGVPRLVSLIANTLNHPRFALALAVQLVAMVVLVVGVITGAQLHHRWANAAGTRS
jgi:hypothetical protein